MNEAAAASKALEDVANNQVIMMELVLYASTLTVSYLKE